MNGAGVTLPRAQDFNPVIMVNAREFRNDRLSTLATTVRCRPINSIANALALVAVSRVQAVFTIEPENEALKQRAVTVEALRAAGRPTLPTRIDLELATNVFLRPHKTAIRLRLGMPAAADWKVFAEMRERKNKA